MRWNSMQILATWERDGVTCDSCFQILDSGTLDSCMLYSFGHGDKKGCLSFSTPLRAKQVSIYGMTKIFIRII